MIGMHSPRRGTTLIELLVVLAVLAATAVVVGGALPARRIEPASTTSAMIIDARRRAIESGRPVPLIVGEGESRHDVLALPDGRVLGARGDSINSINGQRLDAPR